MPPRPASAHASVGVSPDERRQLHIQKIRDLGSRVEECWAEYRESEIMKCRCSLVHWHSRQKALEAEVAYSAEVVTRKTDVLRELEKNYSEVKRQPQPVPVYGARAGVQAEELAADYPAPLNPYGGVQFKRADGASVQMQPRVFKFNHHGA
tara:strand:+ start:2394 stop:2846 length:453 start_codon:yes stop_codon:yes gene_type:complete